MFVQLVMAAMTTAPSCSFSLWLFTARSALFGLVPKVSRELRFTSGRLIRSCGRFGPAIEGTTVER